MNTYLIPRNTKGEGKILYIFSTKALIYCAVSLVLGAIIYFIFNAVKLSIVGIIIAAILVLLAFVVGTVKIPDIAGIAVTKKIGGQNIDEIILKYIKFKMKKNKIYIQK